MLLNNGMCTRPCVYKTPYGFCQLTCCAMREYYFIESTDNKTQKYIYKQTRITEQYDTSDPDYGIGNYS